MAISLKTTPTWLTFFGTVSPVQVGTPAAGDRYFLWMCWKPYTAISAPDANWTEIAEFADGTVAQADSVGSMKVACFYRDWQSGDADPTITMSGGAMNIGAYVMQLWQKGANETWDTPASVTAAWPSQSTGTVNASSAVAVKDGSVVMCLMAFPDDTATMTRTTTSLSASPAMTWAGNYVESPVTHLSSPTNNDMACDLGHRFVTTGHASTTLSSQTTIALAKTGSVLWVVQGVTAAPAVVRAPANETLSVAVRRASLY